MTHRSVGLDGEKKINRRAFLQALAATASLTLSLAHLTLRNGLPTIAEAAEPPVEVPPGGDGAGYRNWEVLYRQQWTWDRIAKGTHLVNCWYQRACNWNVYVKDGLVFREEQVGTYPRTNADVPDFNPRGCQKGACYGHRMYDPARIRYPLKRAGRRGEGKWKRVSWSEALRDIADRSLGVLSNEGPGAIVWDPSSPVSNRVAELLDTPTLNTTAEVGDHHPGTAITCGKVVFSSSADDLFYSDLILIWGGNPVYTQIPNAHFINEARYNGARVVTIAPDYSASAIHADQWVPVNVGTDAALGLSMAQVIVEEDLLDRAFIAEQTDLPLLVRKDTRRFLRASDLGDEAEESTFYLFDRSAGRIRAAPKRSLALLGIDPALEGDFKVSSGNGELSVTPVFALLRERLSEYAPEAASNITGVSPDTIRNLARRIAAARAATFLPQSNFSKFYHGLEMERAQILVLTLCGQIGKKGSGIAAFPYLSTATAGEANGTAGWKERDPLGRTLEMMEYDRAREQYPQGTSIAAGLFLYKHCGLEEPYGSARKVDPWMGRSFESYLAEALKKGWQFLPETAPRILFELRGNLLRRTRGYDKMVESLLPALDLLVTADSRMSNTARYSDYVLPMAGWYEKDGILAATPISPFAHVVTRATEPVGESRSDWEFYCLFLKALQERACDRGIRTYQDRKGKERRIDTVYDEFTSQGRFTEHNYEDQLEADLSDTTNLGGTSWQELKATGFARYTGLGLESANLGNATDINPTETITANSWHTQYKLPWPTLTRRLQFFIDHEYFLELREELPAHKDNPAIGGNYPLAMSGGHTRWSIHASWRDAPYMARLERGEPLVTLGPGDAASRGLRDGDRARIRNDTGSFEAQVRISSTVRPGQVIVYHAWEPFQFRGHRSHQVLTPSPMNPIQVAGGYGHLQASTLTGEPGLNDRGTRVEVERIDTGEVPRA